MTSSPPIGAWVNKEQPYQERPRPQAKGTPVRCSPLKNSPTREICELRVLLPTKQRVATNQNLPAQLKQPSLMQVLPPVGSSIKHSVLPTKRQSSHQAFLPPVGPPTSRLLGL
ncbi:hypothetical protein BGX38DRAFT_1201407, partial [Terfezia claveryi]